MATARILLFIAALLTLPGCVSKTVKSTEVPALDTPSVYVEEAILLDVGVVVFDPGLDEYDGDDEDIPVYPEVRRAESLFLPKQLSEALQDSGAWGAVRVLPNEEQYSDILLTGTIVHSDGEALELDIVAIDSSGEVWLEKTYRAEASRYAYTMTARNDYDPFQAVFNTVANDLLQALEARSIEDRQRTRLVTELRFAQSFSTEAFSGYLESDNEGDFVIVRLPAEEDPMLIRVRKIRERDHLFVDTLQDHYANFDELMSAPYDEWRKLSYEEVVAIRELRAESMRQIIGGAIAVIGGIAAGVEGDSPVTRAAGRMGVLSGAYLLKSGLHKRNETEIHVEALQELGTSLEAEIAPKVIELEDRTITLSGTVEEQYAQWRALLGEIYRTEIGDLEALPDAPPDPATL